MITYLPSYIVGMRQACIYDSKQPNWTYLPLWEHFARRAMRWNINVLEVVSSTSGRGDWAFPNFYTKEQVHESLACLFSNAGASTCRGRFLAACGIRKWADLAKPIRITGWGRDIPFVHDVCERKMKQPGPNECHPGAIFGQKCALAFRTDGRWRFLVYYGFSRDRSSWDVSIRQSAGESLYHFGQRIPAYIESLFEPDDPRGAHFRLDSNRQYQRRMEAVETLFSDDYSGVSEKLAGAITTHIKLTPRRCATLLRWDEPTRKAVR